MKKLSVLLCLLTFGLASSQVLQSPSDFLGYDLGTKFTRHHRVVDYCHYLARAAKDRVYLSEYGRTNEDRPLLLLQLSSAENMNSLEEIRQAHLESLNGGSGSGKAIVWLSYNVHGNESVSTEAAMQTLYELLTSKKEYLDNSVIIVDPCINPDGRDRYVNWYNQVKNTPYEVDPLSAEHNEGWLSGRSNHYMFDLNRDWAWLTQLESRQRIVVYNQWLPHIHVDFHEQGVDYPYYFAPAAEPFHEVITSFQREFQTIIGKNHAKYFDANGWLYFTKERFDLFYPSYGDTYPTYNGAIGMTYEQGGGGRAGLGILTQTGDTLTLKDRIAHHLTTGLSTVEVAFQNADKLNEEFAKFFKPKKYRYQTYVMKGKEDHLQTLTAWLDRHGIDYGRGTGTTIKGYRYNTRKLESFTCDEQSLVIGTDQPKGTLVKVLFEPDAKLSDSLTYDITAWSLPYAYGLDAMATGNKVVKQKFLQKSLSVKEEKEAPYAYIADWNSMQDARFLSSLLRQGIRVRSTQESFKIDNAVHPSGTLIITKKDNEATRDFEEIIQNNAKKYRKELFGTKTGFVDDGRDLGSRHVKMLRKPKVAVISGTPTSTLSFGEIWYFMEQELDYPMTTIEAERLKSISLSDYDVLVMPHGSGYENFMNDELRLKLRNWAAEGGNLILFSGAIKGFAGQEGYGIRARKISKDSTKKQLNKYDLSARERLKEDVKGAIFKTDLDPSHPLAFGYDNFYYTLKLRNGSYNFLDSGNVATIGKQTQPVAGFSGSETPDRLVNSLVFGVEAIEKGRVIYFVDNPLFRGFWENGKLFFANALFMVH
ncbi:MAG: M14 family metallopeptidase [Flavobacteriaceae bacterium]